MDVDAYLREFINYVYYYSAGFSVAFNLLLIYLVLNEQQLNFAGYKRLMVITAVFEIFYSILDAYLVPVHYSHASAIVELVIVSDKFFDRSLVNLIHFVYNSFFGAFLALMALHFIYRWLAVTGHKLLGSFHSWKLFFWMLIPVSTGLVYAFLAVYLCGPNQKTSDFLREGVFETFRRDIDDFDYLAMYLFEEKENGEIMMHMDSVITIGTILVTVTPSFFLIIFFGVKCYHRIRKLVQMTNSTKHHALQSQLFYALVIQTLIPVLLMHIPVTILMIFAFTGVDIGKYGVIVSTTVTLYPAIDPLPTFFIVKPFRRKILDFITCKNIEITFKTGRSTERATLRI